jgi:cell wall-associated NlpC family hydrolase
MRLARFLLPGCALLALAAPSSALAAGGSGLTTAGSTASTSKSNATATKQQAEGGGNGGSGISGPSEPASTPVHPTVTGDIAKIINGVAYAPSYAPLQVKQAIWAGNRIRTKPYVYGGGHGEWNDVGYDCSGSVSYVLHAAGLLKVSEASGEMESWGQQGIGQWVTVYANGGHAFVEIAGIRFDTSAEQDPNPPSGTGPRWRPLMTDTSGFMARHPAGL